MKLLQFKAFQYGYLFILIRWGRLEVLLKGLQQVFDDWYAPGSGQQSLSPCLRQISHISVMGRKTKDAKEKDQQLFSFVWSATLHVYHDKIDKCFNLK